MTREQYQQMRRDEVQRQKNEIEQKRTNPAITSKERNQIDAEYQALLAQQADWEKAGFWTTNEETAYKLNYERYHDVQGSYRRSSV